MSNTNLCLIDVAYGDPCESGLPVSVGVPFQAGVFRDTDSISVISPSGEQRPAAGRTLAHWPDGSVRWCLVSFGAHESGSHELLWSQPEFLSPIAVSVGHSGSDWLIDTGRMRLTLSENAPSPITSLCCDGHEYLSDAQALIFSVDEASSQHEEKRNIHIIEVSPLRARLRIEGAHYDSSGERNLSYRLDVEAWAGWPTVRLDYQFFNLEPGADSRQISRVALDVEWNLEEQTERHFLQENYGLMYVSRHVFNPDKVGIVTDFSRGDAYVEDAAMLLDNVDYPFYLHAPLVSTYPWLSVQDEKRAVYVQLQEFVETRPNRIASEGRRMEVEFWPKSAGSLDLPQGRSKRHTVLLSFAEHKQETIANQTAKLSHAPYQAPTGMASALGALCYEERACVSPAWLAHCGEFDQNTVLPHGQHVRIENNLAGFMHLNMPNSKFDVGDTDSHYTSSYSLLSEDLVPSLAGTPKISRVWPGKAPTQTYLDCHEPVWTNNEYDAIHAFANEIMRTGRHDLLSTLRLTARHNIEVDFLHYSDHRWLNRATPAHSVRHTTTGAYPSHFWTQGLIEYYCMSGDEDALEVAVALADKTVENFTDAEMRPVLWGFNREVGWSVLSLVHVYDITREERFKPLLDELVDSLVSFDRNAFSGAINLSAGNDRLSMNRQIVSNFFGYASMVDAIDRYAAITGREQVNTWLKQFCYDIAEAGLQAAREGEMPSTLFSILLSVGYERTGDKRFLAQIGLLLDQVYWNGNGLNGGGSIKPIAGAYRGWTRMLGHALKHGLLDAYEFPSVLLLKNE
ncbi:MAG: beta-L-arabinofuranosidase domain-containing protein [Abditibacteriaceae bacterium]